MFRRVLLATALTAVFVSAASAATVTYTAKLSGSREVPKTDSKGTGKLDATFDTKTKELKYTLTFDGLSGPATAAHFHGPANMKANAGVVGPLGDKSPTSPVTGTITLTDDQAKELQSAKIYANVHTAANPGGEIRGQLHPLHAKKTAAAKPAPTATAPAPASPSPTAASNAPPAK
jgi:hypothetical protein